MFRNTDCFFFCENHEERGRRGRKKDLRKKKAFAFFLHLICSSSFTSLISRHYINVETSNVIYIQIQEGGTGV